MTAGAVGVVLGAASTATYAHAKGWAIVIPPEAWAGGLGAALLIGAAGPITSRTSPPGR